ncbi:MAG: hypothetical protein Q9157_004363 [Trypethelium eluteriae]
MIGDAERQTENKLGLLPTTLGGEARTHYQLLKEGLRTAIQNNVEDTYRWDESLEEIVRAMNTRAVKFRSYYLAPLLTGIEVRMPNNKPTFDDEIRREVIRLKLLEGNTKIAAEFNPKLRMAELDEIRDRAI